MDINDRLYVEIAPYEGPRAPVPHPVRDAGFDPGRAYKVLGMYNASETSECYFVLANDDREIWFIPQRHLRAYRLIDGDAFSLPLADPAANGRDEGRGAASEGNGTGRPCDAISSEPTDDAGHAR